MNLTTTYCRLKLSSPFIVGASPLSRDVKQCKALVKAGGSMVVMWSLFEEQLIQQQAQYARSVASLGEITPEASSFLPDPEEFSLGPEAYLSHLSLLKRELDVPVWGSLNGSTPAGWVEYASQMVEAGADGIELNSYEMSFGIGVSTAEVESRICQLVRRIREVTDVPLSVKLLPHFAGLADFTVRLEQAGADGVVLFNRMYEPVIDLEELELTGQYPLSEPADGKGESELGLRLRWLGLLSGDCPLSLGASGGVHHGPDAVRALMAGADGLQMVSALLLHGPSRLAAVKSALVDYLTEHSYKSLDELRGSMDHTRCPDPWAYSRSMYIRTLAGWNG